MGAVHAAPAGPESTVKAFETAVAKRDVNGAMLCIARFPTVGEEHLKQWLTKVIDAEDGTRTQILGSKEVGECAVVAVLSSPRDPDPFYLLKQEGEWRILPRATRFDYPFFGFSASIIAEFRSLEDWYRQKVGKPPKVD